MYLTFLQGFALSITLILAIGAQNAFVLRQGLRGAHIFWVCLVCGFIDAVLILAGITGFGALAQSLPWFETAMRYGGAAFLLWYGWMNAVSAWKGGNSLEAAMRRRPKIPKNGEKLYGIGTQPSPQGSTYNGSSNIKNQQSSRNATITSQLKTKHARLLSVRSSAKRFSR
ncbi:LysE family transporter [Ascidiaceihabitans sp.]|nr:LysE family transporter [Ascidiaceihabitans sp.]